MTDWNETTEDKPETQNEASPEPLSPAGISAMQGDTSQPGEGTDQQIEETNAENLRKLIEQERQKQPNEQPEPQEPAEPQQPEVPPDTPYRPGEHPEIEPSPEGELLWEKPYRETPYRPGGLERGG